MSVVLKIAPIDSFFLKYISGCKEHPQFYATYGKFMHKLIELIHKGEMSKDEAQTKFLCDFSTEVQGIRPSEKIVRSYIEKGLNYLKSVQKFPYNPLGIEKRVKFEVGGFPFVGVIDYLGEQNGELYIIDNKSRDLKPRSKRSTPTVNDNTLDEMLKQLYLYSIAVKSEFGKYPKALCFNCFKSGVFIEEPFVESKLEETIKWTVDTINDIIKTEDFSPYIEYFPCTYICGVNDECIYREEVMLNG